MYRGMLGEINETTDSTFHFGGTDYENYDVVMFMGYDPDVDHTLDEPDDYREWRDYVPALRPAWPGKMLSWTYTHPISLDPITRVLFREEAGDQPHLSFWLYRRMICRDHYLPGAMPHEVTLVNWPQIDYVEGNIIDKGEDRAAGT